MTSRRPEPFDQISRQVSGEKAAEFHERWVVGYGHASVAEHAVLHLAVENISRRAVDALEDNRLASYTEKSSRYQVISPDAFHIPEELEDYPQSRNDYITAAAGMMTAYRRMLDRLTERLRQDRPRRKDKTEAAYAGRLTRQAAVAARSLLPAATLTNVGVTMNARALEHAVSKLLSSGCKEKENLGAELRPEGRRLAPTLVKYATASPYLTSPVPATAKPSSPSGQNRQLLPAAAGLMAWDPHAEARIAAALSFRREGQDPAALLAAYQPVPPNRERETQKIIA